MCLVFSVAFDYAVISSEIRDHRIKNKYKVGVDVRYYKASFKDGKHVL